MNKKKKQPWGIIANSIILWVGGLITIVGAIGIAVLGALGLFTEILPVLTVFAGIAFIMFILGVAMLLLGWGLWIHSPIAWWITFVLIGIGVVGDLISWFMGYPEFLAIIIGVFLFLGLIHADTIKAVKPGIRWDGWKLNY